MDSKLKELLIDCDTDGIRDYMFEKEMEYYENDLEDMVITLDTVIPQYDILVESLGIENVSISADLFSDEKAMYSINAYRTNIPECYFIVTEEFGLDDGYEVYNEFKFTGNMNIDRE